jgi:hypothetical protein
VRGVRYLCAGLLALAAFVPAVLAGAATADRASSGTHARQTQVKELTALFTNEEGSHYRIHLFVKLPLTPFVREAHSGGLSWFWLTGAPAWLRVEALGPHPVAPVLAPGQEIFLKILWRVPPAKAKTITEYFGGFGGHPFEGVSVSWKRKSAVRAQAGAPAVLYPSPSPTTASRFVLGYGLRVKDSSRSFWRGVLTGKPAYYVLSGGLADPHSPGISTRCANGVVAIWNAAGRSFSTRGSDCLNALS